jgi:hypothetical protein
MFFCKAKTNFVNHLLGAKKRGETFWAAEDLADHLVQIDAAEVVEGNGIAQTYATKVVPLSALQVGPVCPGVTLTPVESVGPSGPSTTPIDSAATASTPATGSGGTPTPKRRGRPPKSGPKTKARVSGTG